MPDETTVPRSVLRRQRVLPSRGPTTSSRSGPELRAEFGIPADAGPVILSVVATRSEEAAASCCSTPSAAFAHEHRCTLLIVGSGPMRGRDATASYVRHALPDVVFAGFLNQSEISRAYAAADIFALASGWHETWGLVVNEAMNFGLPVVVSDKVGCAADLVRHGENGYVFPHDRPEELAAISRPADRRPGAKGAVRSALRPRRSRLERRRRGGGAARGRARSGRRAEMAGGGGSALASSRPGAVRGDRRRSRATGPPTNELSPLRGLLDGGGAVSTERSAHAAVAASSSGNGWVRLERGRAPGFSTAAPATAGSSRRREHAAARQPASRSPLRPSNAPRRATRASTCGCTRSRSFPGPSSPRRGTSSSRSR